MKSLVTRSVFCVFILALALPVAPVLAQETQQQQQTTADDAHKLSEEMVVTARKKEEAVQDVPLSVAAPSGEKLRDVGAEDIEDVAAYLAGEQIEADANAKPVGTPPAAAETCKTCHGPVGVPDAANRQAGAATLAGQHADYLQHALERYRIGARKNALMQPFATQLKPEDIRALAEFYSRQQPALKTVPLRENVVTGQK